MRVTVIRPEIQGLRAVAVSAVLIFHVWPDLLSGGYVGVDVFFVISGFLITSLLVREVEAKGRIDFRSFYLRRARRLLPAAALVLAVTGFASIVLLPADAWRDTMIEIVASTFYVENWRLAAQSVDYLAADNAPSAVQHYWSLSIEEQFYLVWPGIVALAAMFASRRLALRTVLLWAFVAVFGLSLWASISTTANTPQIAYFVTYTRIWELALGGLLAVSAVKITGKLRELTGLTGLCAILVASALFDKETSFPGYAALLPTVGTGMVILAGQSAARWNPSAVLSSSAFQFLGDISYSVYLWHWPFVVFLLAEGEGGGLGIMAGFLVVTATIAVSAWSKRHIEDRFRHTRAELGWVKGFSRAVAFSFAPIVACTLLYLLVARQQASLAAELEKYPGAMVFSGVSAPKVGEFAPALSVLKQDRAAVYDNGCHLDFSQSVPVPCHYGKPDGAYRVFLVGDSHAANWIPALEVAAERHGWAATSYTKSSCALLPIMVTRSGKPYKECMEWGKEVREIILEQKPDLVLVAQMYSSKPYAEKGQSRPSLRGAIVDSWREIESQGVQVVAIADTPRWKKDPARCLSKDRECSVPLREIKVKDPLVDAVRREPKVGLVNFADLVCPDRVCPAVIGNVVVWRDKHHLTASYSRTMAPAFFERVMDAARKSEKQAVVR